MTTMLFFSGWLWCIVVVGVACVLLLWEKVSTEPQSQDGKNSGSTEVSSVRGVLEVLCRLR